TVRIAHPSRLRVLYRFARVEKNLAEDRAVFIKNDDQSRSLNDLERYGDIVDGGDARGLTVRDGVILPLVLQALNKLRRSGWLERHLVGFHVCGDIDKIPRSSKPRDAFDSLYAWWKSGGVAIGLPDSGEVRFTVSG